MIRIGVRKKLFNIGHSKAIVIPKKYLAGKKAGDEITVVVDPDEINLLTILKELKRVRKCPLT